MSATGAEGESNAHCAPFLVAWRMYFPHASIVGSAIDDFGGASSAGIAII